MNGSFGTRRGEAVQLEHDLCREPEHGSMLLEEMAATDLKDQEKLAVLLQAAALLSHGAVARQIFGDKSAPWRDAALDKNLRLQVGPCRPGRFTAPTQSLLSELAQMLFHCHGPLAGRGVARRSARHLLQLWSQELVPLAADRAIGQIFAAAPFLWDGAWGLARQALAAGLRRPGDSRWYLLMAGPGGARRRFLRAAPTLESARALLGGREARELFEGADESSDPAALLAEGQPLRAVAAWRRSPPEAEPEKLQLAQLLLDLGQGLSAAELLEGLSSPSARLLRAQALLNAGERHRAEKALVFDTALFPALALQKAELEIRLLGGQAEHEAIRRRVAPLLVSATARPEGDPLRLETFLLAAGAAWDCGDRRAMLGYLEAAGEAAQPHIEGGRFAWRFHQLQALAAREVGDGVRAVECMRAALRGRRGLSRHRAGRLWNDMAVSRVLAGDLGGAERAARHAWRLLESSEGSGPLSLALTNLAEIRLRRGRFEGVEATLERSMAQNRLAANWRGLLLDLETMARLELGLGRPAAALARCAEALDHPEASAARHEVFELLAARAHGWLGRPEEAARCLDAGGATALGELEAEERPALLALAGRLGEALAEAHGTPWQGIWQALAVATHPPHEAWQNLRLLEPYRAARLVFDCERHLPGVAPREELRRARATFEAVGAEGMALLMTAGAQSLPAALERYAGQTKGDLEAARELLENAGYGGATLSFIDVAGRLFLLFGSDPQAAAAKLELLTLPCAGGELRLHARQMERELAALFALLRRDLENELEKRHGDEGRGDGEEEPYEADAMPFAADGIVGRDPLLIAAVRRLDAFAPADVAVLILGESGSGKELFARRLHRRSRRAKGPFLAVNCAALSESLILSDLFGHVRGGFTGADRDRAGIFESARGGTVFLDEIGDLPLSCQGHLLRVLQESEIRRVGESFARKVDVRIVTATHRDLDQEVAAGRFRLDLYYRLRAASVVLPALRQRLADLPALAIHFLNAGSLGKKPPKLSKEAQLALARYSWPGNIRELKNVVEVAAALAEGEKITVTDLELPFDASAESPPVTDVDGNYHQQIEDFRRRLVKEALAAAKGQRSDAARKLGLTRQALSYLIRQLGLH